MDKRYSIRTMTMLGTHHSWAVTMRSLFYYFIKNNHQCYLNSINGYTMCPKKWETLIEKDIDNPDIDFCYTAPRNFATRFKKDAKLKMAIYNYETDILPPKWLDVHKHLDFVLPSSEFSKEVFVKNGWPEEKCIVVPHGIHPEEFKISHKQKLGNDKPFRFLNVSIPHYRKNMDLLIEAYYEAFYGNKDVCLVLKTNLRKNGWRKKYTFECNIGNQLKAIQKKYIQKGMTDLPQIEFFQDRVDSMVSLYNSCDVLVSASSSEGFGLPLLEGLAANMLVIAPNVTGQKDFLNKNNSLLVDVKSIPADERYQYWTPSKGATTYLPIKDDLAQNMINAYQNHKALKESFNEERLKTIKKFTWENAASQIIGIANDSI